jgi:hypothetical protein
MTLPRLYALRRYWTRHPPVHLLVAAFVGYKPPEPELEPEPEWEERDDVDPHSHAGMLPFLRALTGQMSSS